MGKESLVEPKIRESLELTRLLDGTSCSPQKALWYYYDDVDEWRLILAGSHFDELLPQQELAAYKEVATTYSSADFESIQLSEIKIMRTDEPILKVLSGIVRTGPSSLSQIRFSNTTINQIFISEMLIIRST